MTRKYIRLNYLETALVPAQVALQFDLNPDDANGTPYPTTPWDMSGLLDFLSSSKQTFDLGVPVGDEFAEIEQDSHSYRQSLDIYGFQLSKLRETNIPAKKKLGEIKEQILLDDDEYIGEFISVLYDHSYQVAMIQSNMYGLSTKQIEHYLTNVRLSYLDQIGKAEGDPLVVRLLPIMDAQKVDKVLRAGYYRKLGIKGSNVMMDVGLTAENSLLSDLRRTLMKTSGVNIEIQVSVGRAEKTATLDEEAVRQVVREFQNMGELHRPKIEVTMLDNEESQVEVVNLIEPRMTDRISVEVTPRTTIGHEYLFEQMLETYISRRSDIRRVLEARI